MRVLILAALAASGISYEFLRPIRAERPQRAGGRHSTLGVTASIPTPNPYLVFAPLDGGGMGAECACSTTPVAGLWDGGTVALTFTRASAGYCTKGALTSGIDDGDLVECATNQPRVMSGGSPGLGLLVEGARTNNILRSNEIDNAAWTKGASVGAITANYATAPDGTLTADRYQYSNTNNDYVLQACNFSGAAGAYSVYLRGTSGSGTLNLCRTGGAGQCVSCPYSSTSWSRCAYSGALAASVYMLLGCETGTLGGACAQTGLDVLVWNSSCEAGDYPTSPISTVASPATRAADVAYIDTGATSPLTGDNMTISAAFVALPATTTDNYPALVRVASDSNASNSGKGLWLYSPNSYGATFACLSANEAGGSFLTGVAARDGGANVRGWCSTVDSGVVSGAFNGVAMSDSSATSGSFSPARYVILAGSTLASPDAIKKDICLTEYQIDAGVCTP